jgi:hypothetical protein
MTLIQVFGIILLDAGPGCFMAGYQTSLKTSSSLSLALAIVTGVV